MYSIRVWQYLDDGTKKLLELEETTHKKYANLIYKEFKEMYANWNNQVEFVEKKFEFPLCRARNEV